MTASARGCPSAPSSIRTACGTPLSVRMKSSAVSENTTLAALVFTSTGTSTRLERDVSVGICGVGDGCPVLWEWAVYESERNSAVTIASFKRCIWDFPTSLGTLLGVQIANYG